jgi:hypothetical protein
LGAKESCHPHDEQGKGKTHAAGGRLPEINPLDVIHQTHSCPKAAESIDA